MSILRAHQIEQHDKAESRRSSVTSTIISIVLTIMLNCVLRAFRWRGPDDHGAIVRNKKSELQILELAPEYRYSVFDHPYSSILITATIPLPHFIGALPHATKSSGLPKRPPATHPSRLIGLLATPPESPFQETSIGTTKLLFGSCPTSLLGTKLYCLAILVYHYVGDLVKNHE